LFSLGVILYEMATGARPFSGNPAQIAAQLLGTEPRPPREANPGVPPRLERVIARCMAKPPADRYPSAAELLDALRHVRDPEVDVPSRKRKAKKPRVDSVAVLPFANATGDAELDYLSDGIAEGVLHQLSQTRNLRVLARATTFRYRSAPDPVAVGRELKVRAVLTGEVSLRRGEVAVLAELVGAKKGTHLWGNVYTNVELRIIQGQIAIEAAEALDPCGERKTPRAPVDEEAYRHYLRGRFALNKGTSASLRSAIQSFQDAIDRDPTLALGFAGLADAFLMFESFAEAAAPGSLSKARAAALRAIQLEDSLAEAHTSLAMADFSEWKWEEAERGFRRAITLNPNYDVAHNGYSMFLVRMGRLDEALKAAKRANEINPLSTPFAAHLAAFKVMVGRKAEGLRELRQLVDAEPNVPMIRQWLAYAYDQNGEMANAVDEARREAEISGNGNLALAVLAYHLCQAGQKDEVRTILETMLRRNANGEALPIWIAGIYAGLGEREKALTWLEKAVLEVRSSTTTYITWPPWFDGLRNEFRYVALLRHMGLAR
jgi:TolB-like protein/Flp pilus assembly protein TadD